MPEHKYNSPLLSAARALVAQQSLNKNQAHYMRWITLCGGDRKYLVRTKYNLSLMDLGATYRAIRLHKSSMRLSLARIFPLMKSPSACRRCAKNARMNSAICAAKQDARQRSTNNALS